MNKHTHTHKITRRPDEFLRPILCIPTVLYILNPRSLCENHRVFTTEWTAERRYK